MGLFVIWGDNTTVRNLTLTRSRVPDMNGAAIRLVKGSLTVDTVKFIDNQTGLFGGAPGTTVTVRNSDFDRTAPAPGRAHTGSISKTSICCASRTRTSLALGRLIRSNPGRCAPR